jgi:hypothetical protein
MRSPLDLTRATFIRGDLIDGLLLVAGTGQERGKVAGAVFNGATVVLVDRHDARGDGLRERGSGAGHGSCGEGRGRCGPVVDGRDEDGIHEAAGLLVGEFASEDEVDRSAEGDLAHERGDVVAATATRLGSILVIAVVQTAFFSASVMSDLLFLARRTLTTASGSWPKASTTVAPAALRAATLPACVPRFPSMMAPACENRVPAVAAFPPMYAATGLVILPAVIRSASSSSWLPPIRRRRRWRR